MMRKGFLAGVATALIAGGTAFSQVPYGLPYAQQSSDYSYGNGYGGYAPAYAGYAPAYAGYAPAYAGYAPAYAGYAPAYAGYPPASAGYAPVYGGYAPQMTYNPASGRAPGYGYASTAQAQPASPVPAPVPGTTMPATVPAGSPVAAAPQAGPVANAPQALSLATTATCPSDEPATPASDCCACKPCGPPGRFWVSADYILWATTGEKLPPLVTAAPANSTSAVPGALGNPDTTVLFGDQRINDDLRSGVQGRAGFWLDECHKCGVEASFFYLSPTGTNFSDASDGSSVSLFRPIFNPITGMPGVEDVAVRGVITGQVGVDGSSTFLGGDVNLRHELCCCDNCCHGYRIDWLAGFRTFAESDNLEIGENLTPLFPVTGAPAGSIMVQDRFRTWNQFYGMQLGLDGQWWWKKWFVDARALAAIGFTHQTVDIQGTTVFQPIGAAPVVEQGGLLALSSNIGHYCRDPFTFSPAGELKVGYMVCPSVRLSVGYDYIYSTDVARAANQIDLAVNPHLVPGAAPASPVGPLVPAFSFHGSDFWAQGLILGVEVRF
jgi:Putative beta barrel porin-7 (BBP7)